MRHRNVSDHEQESVPIEPPGCCGESPPTVGRLQVPDTEVALAEPATIVAKSISKRSKEVGVPAMPPRMMIGVVVRSKIGMPVDATVVTERSVVAVELMIQLLPEAPPEPCAPHWTG